MEKYSVTLTNEDRRELERLVSSGTASARKIRRAQILLRSAEGWSDPAIGAALGVSRQTIHNVRKQAISQGVGPTLTRKPGRKPTHLLDGVGEAHLIALTCSEPPEGQERWSLRLLANRMIALAYVPTVSHETIRQTLKKTNLSLG
jgi:transposase